MKDVVVQCRGVAVGYGETPVLQGVDVEVRRGEVLGIMGGSGSGKSTLLKALVGLLPPMAGTVRLFGTELYGLTAGERSALLRRTGMLFQQGALFGSMTALENVMMPLRELTALPEPIMVEMARMKLALVGLEEFEARLPADLSGGQRKRVALARAAVLDPEIIFCDEPTSGLDPVVAATIDRNLLRLRDVLGITIVAVTHDVETVRTIGDRAVMLAEGGIVAEGTIEELESSRDPGLYAFFHRGARGATDLDAQTEPAARGLG